MKFASWLFSAAACFGQVCSINAPTGCENTDGHTPTLQSFMTMYAQQLQLLEQATTNKAQPGIPMGAWNIPAAGNLILQDTPGCQGPPNTCVFANAAGINAYTDLLVGLHVASIDIAMAMWPMFQAAEYTGGSTASGATAAWYSYILGVYDSMVAHALAKGVTLRMMQVPDVNVWTTCGISFPQTMTEAVMQACLLPLETATAARWGLGSASVTAAHDLMDLSVVTEPSGVWALECGQTFSVADIAKFAVAVSAAARTADSHLKIGAVGTISDSLYIQDWYTNEPSSFDFLGVDIVGIPVSAYYANLQNGYAAILQVGSAAAGLPMKINGLNPPSWVDDGAPSASEEYAILGCGNTEWIADGSGSAFNNIMVGKWAASQGFSYVSVDNTEPFFYANPDASQSNCFNPYPANPYIANVMANIGVPTSMGVSFGNAEQNLTGSLQGSVFITGAGQLTPH